MVFKLVFVVVIWPVGCFYLSFGFFFRCMNYATRGLSPKYQFVEVELVTGCPGVFVSVSSLQNAERGLSPKYQFVEVELVTGCPGVFVSASTFQNAASGFRIVPSFLKPLK